MKVEDIHTIVRPTKTIMEFLNENSNKKTPVFTRVEIGDGTGFTAGVVGDKLGRLFRAGTVDKIMTISKSSPNLWGLPMWVDHVKKEINL